jgi:hypothetical protein
MVVGKLFKKSLPRPEEGVGTRVRHLVFDLPVRDRLPCSLSILKSRKEGSGFESLIPYLHIQRYARAPQTCQQTPSFGQRTSSGSLCDYTIWESVKALIFHPSITAPPLATTPLELPY